MSSDANGPEDDERARVSSGPAARPRVLYVNDDRSLVLLTRRTLELHGYQVTCFHSPVEALAAFRAGAQDFDVVVSDMSMPEMTGLELLQAVLATRADIPCVLSSSCLRPSDEEAARALGVHPLTVDPVGSSELHALDAIFKRT